jgi:uncharacterized protein YneF (UPF0154 family)
MEQLIMIKIVIAIGGFIAGGLYQKWKYYKKTGKHLRDL